MDEIEFNRIQIPIYLNEFTENGRFAAIIYFEDKIAKLADDTGLDFLRIDESSLCIIGVKLITRKFISIKRFDQLPSYKRKLRDVYLKVRELNSVIACRYLYKYPRLPDNIEHPEIAIMLGIFFGYPICDIIYYIQTRYENIPRHDLEYLSENSDRVLCKKCSIIKLRKL